MLIINYKYILYIYLYNDRSNCDILILDYITESAFILNYISADTEQYYNGKFVIY